MARSYAELMVELALKEKPAFYRDQFDRIHIQLPDEDEKLKLNESRVRQWLSTLLWDNHKKTPGSQALRNALTVLEGIGAKEAKNFAVEEDLGKPADENKNQSKRLIELVHRIDHKLYRDERKIGYIYYQQEGVGGYENHPIDSEHVEWWLTDLLWTEDGEVPNGETLKNVQRVLKAKAYNGETITLYNRIAPDGQDGIYIDMGDPCWQVIHVTQDGWSIRLPPKPLFRRYAHQKPLPTPISGGRIKDLFKFVNIKDSYNRILYATSIICYMVPEIEKPVLNVFGPYGSGKSFALELIKHLIDPSITPLLALNKTDEKERVKNLDDHYCAFFDNISYLSQDISDELCRAVTGMGWNQRKLWTNNETFIRQFTRAVGLNGINIPAEQGDLLSRSVNLEVPYLPKEKRIPRKQLLSMLDESTPYLLGALLDALVKTLQIQPTVKLGELSRMGDYTIWGYAAAEALGYDPHNFIEAYAENQDTGSLDVIAATVVGDVLKRFMEARQHETWEGTPQKLYEEFNETAKKHHISTSQRKFPKAANYLTRELNKISPDLRKIGYTYTHKRTAKARVITIESSKFEPDEPQQTFKKFTVEHDPEKKPEKPENGGLFEDLQRLIKALRDEENKTGEAVSRDMLYKALKVFSYKKEYFDRLMEVALRDSTIYEPRPGYYRVAE